MELLYKTGEIVVAGDALATPSVPVDDDEDEETIAPTYEPGSNTALADDGATIEALVLGLVQTEKDRIDVKPLVQISSDSMTATIDCHHESDGGAEITEDIIYHALEHEGVTFGIDGDAIKAGLNLAHDEKAPVFAHPVAHGEVALNGKDAEVHLNFETEKKVGTERHAGGLDFHERDIVVECADGDLICEIVPATAGVDGSDVKGTNLPAKNGVDADVTLGEEVRVSEDGNQFFATRSGVVKFMQGTLSVSDVAVVDGDVDLESGNIRTDDSAVLVRGIVKKGFIVEAASHITVEKSVEDAVIKSAASIQIRRGILHAEEGLVYAEGDVKAAFAQNASIEAGQDIVLGSALNCNLRATGRVIITEGKGRLIGGLTKAHRGVEVKELGAESEVATLVFAGSNEPELEAVERQLTQADQKLRQLNATLGVEQLSYHRTSLPPDRALRRKILEIDREELSKEVGQLVELRDRMLLSARSLNTARIIVHGTAFPGVQVQVYDARFIVDKPMRRCVFSYDFGYDRVQAIPIDEPTSTS